MLIVQLGRWQRLGTTIILGGLVCSCASASSEPLIRAPYKTGSTPASENAASVLPIAELANDVVAQNATSRKVDAPTNRAILREGDATADSGTVGRVAKGFLIYVGICMLILVLLWK